MAATVLLLTLLGAGVVRAADPGQVEELIRQGVALRRAGKDQAALPLFQKAHEVGHTPRTAAQLGLVELALGYVIEAERDLTAALDSSDGWVAKNKPTLERSLRSARAGIGEIAVSGSPEGAEVQVNGSLVGHLPLSSPVRVAQGAATVTLAASGFVTSTEAVTVKGGQRTEVHASLARKVSVAPPEVPPGDGANGVNIPKKEPDHPPETGDTRGTLTILGWSLVGVGAATAAAGGIMVMTTGSDCNPMPGFVCNSTPRSKVPGWALLGGGAAAALAGGIVLFSRPAARVEVGLGPSLALRVPL